MYENENYSDTNRYSSYQTGNYYTSAYETQQNKAKEPEKKKKGGFRKVLLSAGLGLLFGAFAGAGFYGMKLGSEYLVESKMPDVEIGDEYVGTTVLPNNMPTTVNQITYVQDDVSDVVEQVMPAMVSIINNYTKQIYSSH